jgi:hypothetical protein
VLDLKKILNNALPLIYVPVLSLQKNVIRIRRLYEYIILYLLILL